MSPHVLLVSTDLLAHSQFEGAAQVAGATLSVAGPIQAVAAAEGRPPRLVVIDLSAPLDGLAGLVAQLRMLTPRPAVIAFGPHVQEKKLRAAADAGCDAVLTRGQFYRQAAEVIARYASVGDASGGDGGEGAGDDDSSSE